MGLFRDHRGNASKEAAEFRRVSRFKSVDGRDGASGGRTRSVSAELRQKPDKATAELLRAADKGDPAAKAALAANWKRNNH